MFRNPEIQVFTLVLGLICLVVSGLAVFVFSFQVAIYIFFITISLSSSSLIFTAWRYREIKKLSSYLRRISNGEYSLDVRDNDEGELSILKNDIFKVTLMLSEHSTLLQQDKMKLTHAISDISHQLKTPLTSMMMMADLLSNPKLNEVKRMEFTRNIRVQLERIEWLVSSLLKLSKIDAGTINFKKDQVIVHRLIQKAVEAVLIPLDIKQLSLKIVGGENVSFLGDYNWSAEAFINLLKNCVEYTKVGGEIIISFSENPLFTEITIADNGKGIQKKDLPYIFKRFYKGENAGEDSVGIGLAIVYSIIKSQHGDIEVRSEEGKGTSFHIKFYKLEI
ncbi:sensor histidine kinase [Bacillus sp. CGMCC 1.16607]|uniref:sensor histidine kinase n=1 Tax=Bacillus sp. CGMCC 1.16607 TaxID=3351842 RepID=UPI00363AA996